MPKIADQMEDIDLNLVDWNAEKNNPTAMLHSTPLYTENTRNVAEQQLLNIKHGKSKWGMGRSFINKENLKIIKEIEDVLIQKLNNETGLNQSSVPFRNAKKSDLINWPVRRIQSLNGYGIDQLKLIQSKLDEIQFSKEFVTKEQERAQVRDQKRLPKKLKINYIPWKKRKIKLLMTHINDILLQKLNSAFNDIGHWRYIPWKRLSQEGFLNWPEQVPFQSIFHQRVSNLKILAEHLERIQILPEAIYLADIYKLNPLGPKN